MTLGPDMMTALTGVDDRGRESLKRISPFTWVGVALRAGVAAREVPQEFWTQDDGGPVVVTCPCGHSPEVPELETVACACQRSYFNGVVGVWSLNVPSGPRSDDSPAEES